MAVQHSAIADDAAADAGTERQQHQIVHVASGADPLFTQRRGVGVVFEE